MGKDAPDWSDTIYEIQQPSPWYPHGVYDLPGAEVFYKHREGTALFEDFYTVPEGKIVYITNICLGMDAVPGERESVWLGFYTSPGGTWPWYLIRVSQEGTYLLPMTFPVPIQCLAGSVFSVGLGRTCYGWVRITGYILDVEE